MITMPRFPLRTKIADDSVETEAIKPQQQDHIPHEIRIKNRRKRWLDTHPEYFGPSLELADPLLYDRLIRRFQSAAEREAEGRNKGYSGILEADIMRSEAKLDALAHPDPNSTFQYRRGANGEILAEEKGEVPASKEEGLARWRWEMEMRFLRGDDGDFEYEGVDGSEEWDDKVQEDRDRQDRYFAEEEPSWTLEEGRTVSGETGVQDF